MSRRLLVMLTVLLILAFALPASAAERNGLAITVNCTGFVSLGGSIILDRDNTGSGRERFQIIAKDGGGSTIYSGPIESFYVGSTIYFPVSLSTDFATAPASNPIVVWLVSPSGNGFAEQIVYSASGRCSSLPTVAAVETEAIVTTSPSVPLNVLPPSGTNAEADVNANLGYLVVNTSFLNMRSGDGPEYTIVGRVDGADKLIVLGRNDDFSWWFVQAGDVTGWVISDFVVARGDLRGVPIVIPAGEIALPRLFLYSDNVLRATIDGAALCTVEGNLEYEVVGRNNSLTAVKVNAVCGTTPTQGWLPVNQGALRNPAQLPIPVVD